MSDDPDLLPARLQLAIDDFDGARALDLPRPVGFKPVQPTVLAGAVPPFGKKNWEKTVGSSTAWAMVASIRFLTKGIARYCVQT